MFFADFQYTIIDYSYYYCFKAELWFSSSPATVEIEKLKHEQCYAISFVKCCKKLKRQNVYTSSPNTRKPGFIMYVLLYLSEYSAADWEYFGSGGENILKWSINLLVDILRSNIGKKKRTRWHIYDHYFSGGCPRFLVTTWTHHASMEYP